MYRQRKRARVMSTGRGARQPFVRYALPTLALALILSGIAPSCRLRRIDGRDQVTNAAASSTPLASVSASAAASAVPSAAPVASASASAVPPPEAPPGSAVAALGGVGSLPALSPDVMRAVLASVSSLADDETAMAASVQGVATLEDDPQFHAGIGSSLRADGKTVQMDAVVADGTGMFGAVATIERVQNPVRVALALIATRRTMLAGPGATAFARSNGFEDFDPTTAEAKARLRKARRLLATARDAGAEAAATPNDGGLEASAHDAATDASVLLGAETWHGPIAVVVRSADGTFAVAASSSGASGAMLGQVGALPLRGAAVFVGPRGAVAASGPDDDLVREMLARRVYDRLTRTQSPRDAANWALTQIGEQVMVGVIVMDKRSMHVASRGPMAWATWTPNQEQMPEGAEP